MFTTKKKKFNIVKIILLTAAIAAAVAAIATAFMIWKKKTMMDRKIEEEIDAAIDSAFAEDGFDEAFGADCDVSEV